MHLRQTRRYNWGRAGYPFHTLYGFTPRCGQAQMHYSLNKIVVKTDRHVQVTNNLKIAKECQSFPAMEGRNQPPWWQIGRKVMLSLPNINLPNVNKKMKPRWLRPFPITQVNKQGNNYTIDLSSNSDLRQVYTTFHIELLKPYRENKDNEFQQRDYSKPGPVKDHRYEVEEAVDFSFRHPTREDLYQITWKRYLPSHDQ